MEIRSYNLKPGTREAFHQLFLKEALPMLRRWKVDVVGYGPSLHDRDSYFLMRAFDGVGKRQQDEDAFYGSEEWIKGPRERILAGIDSYTTIVISVDEATLAGMRRAGGGTMGVAKDVEELTKLNEDYVQSVQRSDVKRFREILAPDFLCSMPDGSLLDREAFLDYTARPVTIRNLQAQDVNVRLLGDVAIVHARTSYVTADGTPGGGRYTDVWARRDGRWLAVSAHVTRR
ncbi:MAG TPA: nuclear transport factor 2 family protein [Vicinamibacterales bacterium]|nr:nuclear transport factor 2 family protein [Vicinamibacterales bacterium]